MHVLWIAVGMLCLTAPIFAQERQWELVKKSEDTKVYFADAPDSPVKELKIITSFQKNISTVRNALSDVEAFTEWIYACEESYLIKSVSEHEIYYYNRIDFPWPMQNRDLVAHGIIHKDPSSGKVTYRTEAAPDYLPEKDNLIRVKTMEVRWEITPTSDHSVDVVYYLKYDPGGNIPAWLVNLALDQGALQSFERFRKLLQKEKYAGP